MEYIEELVFMKNEDIKELRKKLYFFNNKICPVLKKEIELSDCVLDHKHKKNKDSILGKEDYGCVRNTIDKRVNSFEGKVLKDYVRSGLSSEIELPELLRNLADYLDKGAFQEEKFNHSEVKINRTRFIHPNDVPKTPMLKKRNFNQLKKAYSIKYTNRKELEFPKSGKITKKIEELFKEFDIPIVY